jgi:hypothetical protein
MKKLLVNAATLVSIALIAWFFISFMDVVIHNNVGVPTYHDWNLFNIFWGLKN